MILEGSRGDMILEGSRVWHCCRARYDIGGQPLTCSCFLGIKEGRE